MALKYGPVVLFQFGNKRAVVVSSAEVAAEILKSHDSIFKDRFPTNSFMTLFCGGNDILMSAYNEQWRQLKKFCVLELLSTKRVQSFKYIREEEVDGMIEKISRSSRERGMVNLTETLLTMLNAIIFRCSLGDDYNKEYIDRFIGSIKKSNSLVALISSGDFFPWLKLLDYVNGHDMKMRKVAQELNILFSQIIDDRIYKNSQGDDSDQGKDEKKNFIDILVLHAGKNNPSLTRECMKGVIMVTSS
ncbi:hypothetical protein MKW92_038918 [Papaver armeniacum]|nr:hypothetical protein MKW92_038918 [Papaver armeniacum]